MATAPRLLLGPALAAGLLLGCRAAGPSGLVVEAPPPPPPTDTADGRTTDAQATGDPRSAGFDLALEPRGEPWAASPAVSPRPFSVADGLARDEVVTWTAASLRGQASHVDLPGRAIGLLASVAWWLAAPPNCGDPAQGERVDYHFSRGPSHYALYFPSDGRGFNFLPNWQVELPLSGGGGTFRIDAAMFEPRTENPWGLGACAHLVEVEVNHGRGGRGLHFIASALRVLDGTTVFAGSAQEVLEALVERFEGDVRARAGVIDLGLRSRLDEASTPLPSLPRTLDQFPAARPQMIATWLPEPGALEVVLLLERAAKASQRTGREVIRDAPSCPPGAPCAYREQGTFDTVSTWTLTVAVAARYRVDRQARLIAETRYLPRVELTHASERRRASG